MDSKPDERDGRAAAAAQLPSMGNDNPSIPAESTTVPEEQSPSPPPSSPPRETTDTIPSITSSRGDDSKTDGPPSLDYEIYTRKRIIFLIFFWTMVIADSVFMPIGLYFGLQYGTSLSPNAVFSIVTAALGGVSIVEYAIRSLRLWKKTSDCRPIGSASRWHFDFFHWVLSGMWFVVMVELIVGTCFENPPIRLLSMPLTSLLYVFGVQMSTFEIMRVLKIKSPVKVSSTPKGGRLRPGVYSIMEDIVAVDGQGGTAYRERLDARYRASHVFRSMLERLSAFWAFSLFALAVVMTVLIFTIPANVAYTLGWSVPFVWAGVWALITWWYVRRMLRVEKATWRFQGRKNRARTVTLDAIGAV